MKVWVNIIQAMQKHFAIIGLLVGMSLTPIAHAAQATAQANPVNEPVSTAALFDDLKNYLGVVQAKNIQAQNLLMYMLPPYIDITKAVGSRMVSAQKEIVSWKEGVMRSVANYDVYNPAVSTDAFLSGRLGFCGRSEKNPDIYKCDYLKTGAGNDVLASSLLDPLAYKTESERQAALQYILNLTNPQPQGYPDVNQIFKDGQESKGLTEEGKKYFMKAYQDMPGLSLIQNSLLSIYADRVRFKEFAKDLPVGENGEASMMEMLEYEVSRRYMNPSWYDAMNKVSGVAVQREMANMMAVQMYLDLKHYQQMSRIESLLVFMNSQSAQLSAMLPGGEEAAPTEQEVDQQINDLTGSQ